MAKRAKKRRASRAAVAACIEYVVERIGDGASAAATAGALAKRGDDERAFAIVVEVEQSLHEANALLQAASVLRREAGR
jgi:hypothetical protein